MCCLKEAEEKLTEKDKDIVERALEVLDKLQEFLTSTSETTENHQVN